MSIAYWIVLGIVALFAYLVIGGALGRLSLKVWLMSDFANERFRSGWGWERIRFFAFFPQSALDCSRKGTLVDDHQTYYHSKDAEGTYLRIMTVVWPLKIAWSLVHFLCAAVVLLALAVVRLCIGVSAKAPFALPEPAKVPELPTPKVRLETSREELARLERRVSELRGEIATLEVETGEGEAFRNDNGKRAEAN